MRAKWLRRLEQAFWSGHSRTWDDALEDPAVAAHVAELAGRLAAAAAPGTRCVDLGCGTGNHALALGERGLRVVGIDLSAGMLRQAQAKAAAARAPVVLVQADLRTPLPLPGASVGAVACVYAAQFLPLAPLLTEVRRVTRPDAVVLIEVPQRRQPARDLSSLTLRFRAFQRVKRVVAAVGLRTGRVRWHSPADLRSALRASGFQVLDERASPAGWAVLARRTDDLPGAAV